MTTPDYAENTGDNLRHAAEVQEQAQEDGRDDLAPGSAKESLPDFNT